MIKNPTFTYGVGQSRWMVVRLYQQVVPNQPYYFESDQYINGEKVTGMELIYQNTVLEPYGNLAGTPNDFNLIPGSDLRFAMLYLASPDGEFHVSQMPARLLRKTYQAGSQKNVKKIRTDLRLDPSQSYVIFKDELNATTFPAVFVINLTMKR